MRPFISDQQLLAFLLGGLDSDEARQVAEALENDKHLRDRLRTLSDDTVPLTLDAQRFEPSASLVEKLMSKISSEGDSIDSSETRFPAAERKYTVTDEISSEKASWLDTMAIIACGLLCLSIAGPALVGARETARTSQCAARLAELGQQLRGFAIRNRKHALPEIPVDGPLAFAGAYAIQLHDVDLLEDLEMVWCPSDTDEQAIEFGFDDQTLPSAKEMQDFSKAKLRYWRHIAGGSYAYNLGYLAKGEHCTPTLEDSSQCPILGDSPTPISDENYSFSVHYGDATNILYGDGRVILQRLQGLAESPDHPFFNRAGKMEAGVDGSDNVLGPSFVSPLGELE